MTLAPPRLPLPAVDQRTFLQPPLPGMTSPESGLVAIQLTKATRSESAQTSAAYLMKIGVSATVRTARVYGKAVGGGQPIGLDLGGFKLEVLHR